MRGLLRRWWRRRTPPPAPRPCRYAVLVHCPRRPPYLPGQEPRPRHIPVPAHLAALDGDLSALVRPYVLTHERLPGAYVVDTRTEAVARIVTRHGIRVRLRAPGTGREWDAPDAVLRDITPRTTDALRARVTEYNHLPRLPR